MWNRTVRGASLYSENSHIERKNGQADTSTIDTSSRDGAKRLKLEAQDALHPRSPGRAATPHGVPQANSRSFPEPARRSNVPPPLPVSGPRPPVGTGTDKTACPAQRTDPDTMSPDQLKLCRKMSQSMQAQIKETITKDKKETDALAEDTKVTLDLRDQEAKQKMKKLRRCVSGYESTHSGRFGMTPRPSSLTKSMRNSPSRSQSSATNVLAAPKSSAKMPRPVKAWMASYLTLVGR